MLNLHYMSCPFNRNVKPTDITSHFAKRVTQIFVEGHPQLEILNYVWSISTSIWLRRFNRDKASVEQLPSLKVENMHPAKYSGKWLCHMSLRQRCTRRESWQQRHSWYIVYLLVNKPCINGGPTGVRQRQGQYQISSSVFHSLMFTFTCSSYTFDDVQLHILTLDKFYSFQVSCFCDHCTINIQCWFWSRCILSSCM